MLIKMIISIKNILRSKGLSYLNIYPLVIFLLLISIFDQYVLNNSLNVSHQIDEFVRVNFVNSYELFFVAFIAFTYFFLDKVELFLKSKEPKPH